MADDVGERLAQHGQQLLAGLRVDHGVDGPSKWTRGWKARRSPASEASCSTLARRPSPDRRLGLQIEDGRADVADDAVELGHDLAQAFGRVGPAPPAAGS